MNTLSNIKIFGHLKQFNFLVNSYKKRFPHAWILSGEKGIGKKTLIKKFISCVLANDLFNTKIKIDISFTYDQLVSINKSFNTSVFEITNNHENKGDLNAVREIISKIKLTNFSSKHNSYVLIDNFDDLSKNCQNALLKTIEEPPENTLIFLIAHNIKGVTKTISSRCINLRLNSLNKEEFMNFLSNKNFDKLEENFEKLFTLSYGNPGFFEKIVNLNGMEIIKKIEEVINGKQIDHLKIKEMSEKLTSDSEFFLRIVTSFFYNHTITILQKNTNNIKLYKKIINFLQLLTIKNDVNLNISINQILTSIFVNYFNLIKKEI